MNLEEMRENKDSSKCPLCGKDMKNPSFRDELSKKEFEISGLCQDCQDEFFGE